MRLYRTMTFIVCAFPSLALAEEPWGTPDGSAKCAKEFDKTSPNWINGGYMSFGDGKPVMAANISPECKAEVDKRVQLCLKDAAFASDRTRISGFKSFKNTPPDQAAALVCADESFNRITRQFETVAKAKAEKEAAMAEAAKVELPKSVKKNPAVEKQVAAAYKAAYPENVVLMVIMQSKEWSTERSNYGIITNRNIQAIVVNKQKDGSCQLHNEAWTQEYKGGKFSGKLEQRGAGSQGLTYILCDKVPGAKGKK